MAEKKKKQPTPKQEPMGNDVPDFLEFLRSNGIDPDTLKGLQDIEPGTAPSDKEEKGSQELDIMGLLSQALGTVDGKGMDDDVPAMVDGQEPAALSAGEYVIPADVISLLGDGNSDAGAKVLENLIAQIRQAKTGKPEQPAAMDELMGMMAGGKV